MRTSRFEPEEQRLAVLAVHAGWTVTAVCEAFDISRMTFYRWQARQEPLTRQETLLAAALGAGPRDVATLAAMVRAAKQTVAEETAPTHRPLTREEREAAEQEDLAMITALAVKYSDEGYRRLHQRACEAGFTIPLARVYRLYTGAGLALRHHRTRATWRQRVGLPVVASRPNEVWQVEVRRVKGEIGPCHAWMVRDAYTLELLAAGAHGGPWRTGYPLMRDMSEVARRRGQPAQVHYAESPSEMGPVNQWGTRWKAKPHPYQPVHRALDAHLEAAGYQSPRAAAKGLQALVTL